jgi:hypothetical protein
LTHHPVSSSSVLGYMELGTSVTDWLSLGALDRAARRYAGSRDPLVEASNWAALTVGSHLPFWPLYVWWAAGIQAFPTALLTVSLTPVFIAIPWLSRRSGLLGRITMPMVGILNTLLTTWVLGVSSGTELFLAPCAALAAISFRRSERWIMLIVSLLPVVAWYVLRDHAPGPLHHYGEASSRSLFALNAISIGVLISLFGWFSSDVHSRLEEHGG